MSLGSSRSDSFDTSPVITAVFSHPIPTNQFFYFKSAYYSSPPISSALPSPSDLLPEILFQRPSPGEGKFSFNPSARLFDQVLLLER